MCRSRILRYLLSIVSVIALYNVSLGSVYSSVFASSRTGLHQLSGLAATSAGKAAYDRGLKHYRDQQTTQAIADFEQAIQLGYRSATVYYMLGLSFNRLKQWNNVVWAYTKVKSIDPSFAKSHPTLSTQLANARAKGGRDQGAPAGLTTSNQTTAPVPNSLTTSGPGSSEAIAIAAQLATTSVYGDPLLTPPLRADDNATLQTMIADLQRQSKTTVRVALVHALPRPYVSLSAYVSDLFDRLALKRALVIVASPNGVAARTDRLAAKDIQPLVQASTAQFVQGSYVLGVTTLAQAIVRKADTVESDAERTKMIIITVLLIAAVVGIAVFVMLRTSRWRSRYRQAVEWRDTLAQVVTDTGNHVSYLPDDHQAKQTFLSASAYYSTASTIIDQLASLRSTELLFNGSKHNNALGQARSNLQAAERALQEAEALAGGNSASTAGTAQAAEGGEISPKAEFADRASGQAAQAACFFCAKPLTAAVAQVVSVQTPNGTRRVMACDEHAADVRAGKEPRVLAVPDPSQGGRMTPWWSVSQYNPVRDYDPYYYRNNGIGLGEILLLGALFDRHENTVVYVQDNNNRDRNWNIDQAAYAGYGSDRPDSAPYTANSRSESSAAEASFGRGRDPQDMQSDRS